MLMRRNEVRESLLRRGGRNVDGCNTARSCLRAVFKGLSFIRSVLCGGLLLGFLSSAAAQTFTYPNAYSLLNPFDSRIKYTNFAALVTAGDVEIARLPVPSIFQTSITLIFPPQAAAATVAKVRTGFTQVGTTAGAADLAGSYVTTYTLPTPFAIPASAVTTVVYAPIFATLTVTVTPPLAPPPVVVPPPVVTPPPPPPPATGESPDGSTIPPLTQLVQIDASGAVLTWTKVGTHAFVNTVDSGGSGFDTILYKAKIIYAHQSGGLWWRWNGSNWGSIVGTP